MLAAGIGVGRILAQDIHSFDLSSPGGLNHLRSSETRPQGQIRGIPGFLEIADGLGIVCSFITGIKLCQGTHIAGSLDVVLTPQGHDSCAGPSHLAADQGQIGYGLNIVRAGAVLGYAH